MKYPVNTANGDAGEFFFAYKIASVLKWPCRLFDIDIGIDAQVEILKDDGTSTGRFAAFQIKASSAEETGCRYVSQPQLAYWLGLDIPVFVVLVNLRNETMYLHRLLADFAYPVTGKGAVRIDFDLIRDAFSIDSGAVISDAADEEARSHIQKHLDVVRAGIRAVHASIAGLAGYPNKDAIIDHMDNRFCLYEQVAQARALSRAFNVSDSLIDAECRERDDALDEIREIMRRSFLTDHDDDGRINTFVYENR